MSLSMDLGMPMTEHITLCSSHLFLMALAPALPPFPPTTNTMSMPSISIFFTILLRSMNRTGMEQSLFKIFIADDPSNLRRGLMP